MRKVAFALQMRTRRAISALVVAAGLLAAACGGGPSNVASHSPTPASHSPSAQVSPSGAASPAASSPTPTLPALAGAYGVLVTTINGSGNYTVAIVSVDGKVVASADASQPAVPLCPSSTQPAGAPVPLPLSTSDTRAYFMDGQGVVRFLAPDGSTGRATTIAAPTTTRRAMFAVSPDDRRIAVIVNDYSSSGAVTKLYVEDLSGGTNHVDVYQQSGMRTLWPVGWRGVNNLVLAVAPACTNGGGPFCCGMQELHVVDPATATRRFTIGSAGSCPIVGPPSPFGAVCWDGTQSKVLNWTAGTVKTYPVPGPEWQLLAPGGGRIALVDNNGTTVQGSGVSMSGLFACGWIDDTHVLAGGDSQHQARIGDVSNGTVVPVAAQGDCGGRLPGGL